MLNFFGKLFGAKKPKEETTASRIRTIPQGCGPDERSTWSFVLANNTDEASQKELLDLKLKIEESGVKGTLSLSGENGEYAVTFGDLYLGQLQREDAAWAEAHFSKIEKLSFMHIYGGDRDTDGNPRPLTVKVWANLSPKTKAPQYTDLQLKAPMYNYFTVKGDTVVFVSSTKKIHIPGNCGANLSRCTPMLYQDAADAGYDECANCFR